MDAFVSNVDMEDESSQILIHSEAGLYLVRMKVGGVSILMASYEELDSTDVNAVLYATDNGEFNDIQFTKGYNNVTDGKHLFGRSYTVASVNSAQGWNGILMGAVEGSAPTPTTYTITTNVTNGSYSGDTDIDSDGTASVTITASSGYELPTTVSVSGASHTYDDTTGVISLSDPTGDVTISATCPAVTATFTITGNITNGTLTGATSVSGDNTATCTIVPSAGYTLPASADVTVTGATGSYDDQTGVITISHASANITVTATCPAEQPQALTAIEASDTLTSIRFDTSLSTSAVDAILAALTYSDGYAALIEASNVGNADTGHDIVFAMAEADENDPTSISYSIFVGTKQDAQSSDIDYSDGLVYTSAGGFANLTAGAIALTFPTDPVVSTVSSDNTSSWNGVILGK